MLVLKRIAVTVVALCALAEAVFAQPDLPVLSPDPISTPPRQRVESLQVSPDGKLLAAMTVAFKLVKRAQQTSHYVPVERQVRVWDTHTGQPKWSISAASDVVFSVHFSPDSSRLLLRKTKHAPMEQGWELQGQQAQLHDATTGRPLAAVELEAEEMLHELHFAPDGRQLLGVSSGSKRRTGPGPRFSFNLWDATSGKWLQAHEGLPPGERLAAFSANGKWLLTTASEFDVKALKLTQTRLLVRAWPSLELFRSVELGPAYTRDLVFSQDGTRVALVKRNHDGKEPADNNLTFIWNVESNKLQPVKLPASFDYAVRTLEFLPDGKALMGGGFKNAGDAPSVIEFWFWNTQTGVLERTLTNEDFTSRYIGLGGDNHTTLAPGQKMFYAANSNGEIELCSLEDGSIIRVFEENR